MTSEDKKISSIYKESSKMEPPAHLDDVILAASRDAVGHTQRAKSPFSGGWPVPAAMAAVVIVAIIIMPVVTQESKQEKPVPARIIANKPAAMLGKSTEKSSGKLKQRFSAPVASESPTLRIRQSEHEPMITIDMDAKPMEEQIAPATPAESKPSYFMVQPASPSNGASAGRLGEKENTIETRSEKKSFASDSLLKSERAKRVRSAKGWINYINQLIADNKLERAREELKYLKATYPNYTIDPELTDRLNNNE